MFNKRMRYLLVAVLSLTLVLGLSGTSFADSGTARITGHMVGDSSKTAYFAVGIDGGGPLYKFNVNTGKKKKIASGKWLWLNVKGKYLYVGKNKYGGSDGRSYYIYRMKKNGKSKKKLANGSHPVVVGKTIYYFAMKKHDYYGTKVDNGSSGLYSMKLNGKGKKKLVAFGENIYPSYLAVSGKKLIYCIDQSWYAYDISTKKVTSVSGQPITNIGVKANYYTSAKDAVLGSKTYKISGRKVNIYNSGSFQKSLTFKGEVCKVIASGKHLMVLVEYGSGTYPDHYAGYMMKPDGSKKKQVISGILVSGGWDYN